MSSKLIVGGDLELLAHYFKVKLAAMDLENPNPNLLYISGDMKVGVDQVKRIKDFFLMKAYAGLVRVVVVENANALSEISQNSLLKTIEELGEGSILVLGATQTNNLLPTLLSRLLIETLKEGAGDLGQKDDLEVEKLLAADISERYAYVERLKERADLLDSLVVYFQRRLRSDLSSIDCLKKLMEAKKWREANVNERAILEYLMLLLPQITEY